MADKLQMIAKIVGKLKLKYLGYEYLNDSAFMQGNRCVIVNNDLEIIELSIKQQLQLKPSKITIAIVKEAVNTLLLGDE